MANAGDDCPGAGVSWQSQMLYNVPSFSDYSPLPSYSEVRCIFIFNFQSKNIFLLFLRIVDTRKGLILCLQSIFLINYVGTDFCYLQSDTYIIYTYVNVFPV